MIRSHADKAGILVQCDYNQVTQVWTAVHCELLSTPVEDLFERNNREESDWKEILQSEPTEGRQRL